MKTPCRVGLVCRHGLSTPSAGVRKPTDFIHGTTHGVPPPRVPRLARSSAVGALYTMATTASWGNVLGQDDATGCARTAAQQPRQRVRPQY